MASMKITVDELRYRKTIYAKAAKNLREVIDVVKKAKNSIGNDRMFNETRQSLGKLAENMERRATVLEALAEALTYSADAYKGAQKHSVSVISDFRSHKTDFYGNPVHVSAAAGGAAGAVSASARSQAVSHTEYSAGAYGGVSDVSSSASARNAVYSGNDSEPAGIGAFDEVERGAPIDGPEGTPVNISESFSENNTVINNITNNTIVYKTENYIVNEVSSETADVSGAVASEAAQSVAADSTADVSGPIPAADESSGSSGAAMFGAGMATAAAAGGAAFEVSKLLKKKPKEQPVDTRLEDAKKKLKEIEEEQDMLKASLSLQEEDEG